MSIVRQKNSWWLPPLVAGTGLLALWYAVVAIFKIPTYLLPMPDEVIAALWRERAALFPAALHTGGSALVGFLVAVLGGALVAITLASSRWLKAALYPWVLVVQMIPVVVLVPVFVIWFHAGLRSITAIAFMISFFPVVASTTMGLISTDRGLL